MAETAPTKRWLRAWRSHQRHQFDFGDHGTAFGLDLSLAQAPEPRTLPPPVKGASTHAAATAPAGAPRPGWMQRLRRRTKARPA